MPVDSRPSIFAQLTPVNAPSRWSFSLVYERIQHQTLTPGQAGPPPTPEQADRMYVEAKQVFDQDVFKYRFRQRRGDDLPSSPTDPGTDVEEDNKGDGEIWTGCYGLSLDLPPEEPAAGWTMGVGRPGVEIAILFGRTPGVSDVRGYHARLNFHEETGFLQISARGEVVVDGTTVRNHPFVLNKTPTTIRTGHFEWLFEYAGDYFDSQGFRDSRDAYMVRHLNMRIKPPGLVATPRDQAQIIGGWTINRELGRGASGKVSIATNDEGSKAAIKLVQQQDGKTGAAIDAEVKVFEELRKLKDDEGRLVRLIKVIGSTETSMPLEGGFRNVFLVLQPLAQGIFSQLIGGSLELSFCRHLFRDALRGIRFLHGHGWLHGDIKPANIGFNGCRAILLDVGCAIKLVPDDSVSPTPGQGGTVGYLAPEREMQNYDYGVDLWGMGVIGYEILHRVHPFQLAKNPWRPGKKNQELRDLFHAYYNISIQRLEQDDAQFSQLLIQMLRHPWAATNSETRIDIDSALSHACWTDIDQSSSKRLKIGGSNEHI